MTFAGRRDRMALLKHYAEQALRHGIVDEWHVWNFTRTEEDADWLAATFPALRRTADDRLYRPTTARVPVASTHVLCFEVRAAHDAHLALVADAGGVSYELVLGGWGNSAVAVRAWPAGTLPDHNGTTGPPDLMRPAPAVLSGRAWRAVEVHLIREPGHLSIVLRVAGRNVLRFEAADPSPQAFNVAVMTGYGGEAEWQFASDRGSVAALFYATFNPRAHPWNPVYHYYAARADEYSGTVFLKCDDDIVYFDPDRLSDFIGFRRQHPTYFLVSANVVNNGVCAYVQQQLGMIPRDLLALEMPPNGLCGSLWSSGAKAETLHRWFLSDPARFASPSQEIFIPPSRFSINFVSWLGADLAHFETRFIEDEHDLTVTLPRFLERENVIYLPFVAAHLSFRPQDDEMDVAGILDLYRGLALRAGGDQPALSFGDDPTHPGARQPQGDDTMSDVVDSIMAIVETRGHAAYGAEAVSQYEHAMQSAMLAEQAGAGPALISAALLHDIGHMVSAEGEHAAERGVDGMHERIGQKYLRRWFGADVTEPVALHVAAKRYLCAVEPTYRAALSPASERSLILQGGPFTPDELDGFLAGPYAQAAIALRKWDDEAKVPGMALPALRHFEPCLRLALA